ncbi:alpha/beta-hydrolase [Aspergillus steynii IBT 23096]|uniref:Alpha/beta-hydrolase n=1 Tax=Aspergillus steynii IBT 23096 TaxID=1392250 RepID=A0A2I2GF31_9EURO|nr:alpha/beta-hydrolase [Aspergillus steynii IBT 23096]PLB51485.1 alpha/beta-hydrolase [Aspergillus steynii IBT 23096]
MASSKPFPTPLIIPPRSNQHTHTFILLHGRGSNAEQFGSVFLESTDIARRLPTVKFIFPTAKKRRSTVLKRIPIRQWFDNYSLKNPNTRTELQVDGLEETNRFLRTLVDDEARLFKESNSTTEDVYSRIVIGGLSQGCAASIFGLLGGFSGRLGGFVGMSGWLPFESEIVESWNLDVEDDGQDDNDPFAHDDEDDGEIPAFIRALNHVRDVLDLPPLQHEGGTSLEDVVHLQTPIFLGHGSADPKVSVNLGHRMGCVLSDYFGMDVTWKSYEDFGHWYKVPDEIDDVVNFLKEKVEVPSVD